MLLAPRLFSRSRRTGCGGLRMPLISDTAFVVSVSSADRAAFIAGMASARSASHSCLIAFATFAASAATASSCATT